MKRNKGQITVTIDTDILDWIERMLKTSRLSRSAIINELLHEKMIECQTIKKKTE